MHRSRAQRLISLAAYLASRDLKRTRADIQAAFPADYGDGEAGRMMFARDKRELIDDGFPIMEEDDRYWLPASALYLPDLDLTDGERAALEAALRSVRVASVDIRGAATLVGLSGTPADAAVVHTDLRLADEVALLQQAAADRRVVRGTYSGRRRDIEPYGVIFRRGLWYLFGHDRSRGDRRLFRLDRFQTRPAAVGGLGAFERPGDVDLAGVVPAGWELEVEEPLEVAVRFDVAVARRAVLEAPRAQVEWQEDGAAHLTLEVSNLDAFRSWLFSFGARAVVVGPPAVRASLRAWLEDYLRVVPS